MGDALCPPRLLRYYRNVARGGVLPVLRPLENRKKVGRGTEDNGLSLEGLAQRLEALERENERISSDNAELRQVVSELSGSGARREEVPALRDSDTQRSGESALAFDGQVSRRSLLSKAGAAAVAAVAAGTLMYPRQAKADHFGPGIQVDFVTTHNETPNTIAVLDDSPAGTGVKGQGGNYGVRGVGSKSGVWGSASETGYEGVYGQHTGTSGYGVVGDGKGSGGAGVLGRNPDGPGVLGDNTGLFPGLAPGVVGKGELGVKGEGFDGVSGTGDFDGGYGVIGKGGQGGVWGESTTSHGSGVYGHNTGAGRGVEGISDRGTGGLFNGAKAQLRLVPKPAGNIGPPSGTHSKGEIYMDSQGTLFVCTVGGATPTWRRVQTAAVS